MGKPRSVPVPGADNGQHGRKQHSDQREGQEPLSGSKKTKNENHSRHNNGEG
ncbi:small acid-soluble spore protein P (minor) [Paenibacillus phyllosphaerae]|uniref:Small acid-soluble spore protein P (Minor) n=1 Tax=Paenibacillus phyllosphaerae TaxID=274593 RepID=A0A7W5B3K8_9BACL|nr:small acid-soluble spore protein P [Paenibacillus phyllosphaerae]MBB3113782.1 small acid-soluble spore protein P (minor) [Paenibacillus phyllosphaerae]